MKLFKAISVTLLLAAGAAAQPVNLQTKFCNGLSPAFTAYIQAPGIPFPIPVCATIGPTLKVTVNAAGNYVVDAVVTAAPPAPIPAMIVETVPLTSALPTDSILQYTLKHTPAPGTAAIAFLSSSQAGASVTRVIPAPTTQFQFTLPGYRPFTVDDVVTIVYWSLN